MTNPRINPIKLITTIVVVFAVLTGTNYLIHEMWLKTDYQATAKLWRPEADMKSLMWAMFLSNALVAIAISLLYARIATTACIRCAIAYGLCFGLFFASGSLMSYFVHEIPGGLVLKWLIAGILQGVFLGIVAYVVYKPKAEGE